MEIITIFFIVIIVIIVVWSCAVCRIACYKHSSESDSSEGYTHIYNN